MTHSRIQVKTLDDNCKSFNVMQFGINDIRQGIVHGRARAGFDFAWYDRGVR